MQQDSVADEGTYQKQVAEFRKKREAEMQLRGILQQILAPDAYERLANIQMVDEELYAKIVSSLITLYQSGRISSKLTDEQFRSVLGKFAGSQRETKISFARK
ncbi:hypothetical protein HY995_05675 [Candidatus Micrarchaeota archaeon]|nr:hypothetical protein [Candidatus Micrarchaeota archaeon]MBI5177544.1 hypothetical protein [Candidatus Micrarchaeota archaeon]